MVKAHSFDCVLSTSTLELKAKRKMDFTALQVYETGRSKLLEFVNCAQPDNSPSQHYFTVIVFGPCAIAHFMQQLISIFGAGVISNEKSPNVRESEALLCQSD